MTGPGGEKITARAYSASSTSTQGASPVNWPDKCFLCGRGIGESDPRQFYQGKNALLLIHTGCLNIMNTHGGTPKDYHAYMTKSGVNVPPPLPVKEPDRIGANWLEFENLQDMQAFIGKRGPIPADIKVTVAGSVVQPGE